MTITELFLYIHRGDVYLYYDVFDNCITNMSINKKERDRVVSLANKNIYVNDVKDNIMLPTFSQINHKEIMRFFVRECVYEKEIRKVLFDILRRDEFVKLFVEKLKELDLYDLFDDCCGSIYYDILTEWADSHSIDLKKLQ